MMKYYRDETKLHNVPNIVPAMMMADVFMCSISLIVLIVGFVKINRGMMVISSSLLIVGLLASLFCDTYFNWYVNCCFDLTKSNKIVYSFNLNGIGVGQNVTKITINYVSDFKYTEKKLIIRGSIDKKSPMRPSKALKKVELDFNFDEDARTAVIDRLTRMKGSVK